MRRGGGIGPNPARFILCDMQKSLSRKLGEEEQKGNLEKARMDFTPVWFCRNWHQTRVSSQIFRATGISYISHCRSLWSLCNCPQMETDFLHLLAFVHANLNLKWPHVPRGYYIGQYSFTMTTKNCKAKSYSWKVKEKLKQNEGKMLIISKEGRKKE